MLMKRLDLLTIGKKMNQQEYQQLMSELNYYQDLLEQVDASLSNIGRTKNALEDFEKEESTRILAPIANGVYVEAELKNKNLFVNIGSNVVSKKSIKESILLLDEQETEILADKEKINEKINELYVILQSKGE